jgi:hypothetical protein
MRLRICETIEEANAFLQNCMEGAYIEARKDGAFNVFYPTF